MAELSSRGRVLLAASLAAVVLIAAAFAVLGSSQSAIAQFGRPLIILLAALLVWQGRGWARWLIVVPGIGFLLAGPLGAANGLPLLSLGGLLFWLTSVLYAGAIWVLFGSRDVKPHFATKPPPRPAPN